jgi:DNA replication protein DnaC
VSELRLEQNASACLTTPTALIRRLRDTWGQRGKEQALLNELAAIDVLVLDDLGRSFGSAFEIVQLTEVIDMRYTKRHPTVITSNKNEPQLKKLLGERAFDRLRHGRRIVPLTGESYRRPVAEVAT